MSTPFSAPSAKLSDALPSKPFFSAPTVLPAVVTSIFTVPVPLSMSLLIASTINGPTDTPFMACLKAMVGVARASTFNVPAMLPLYKFAAKGESVAIPSAAFKPRFTFSVLTLASLSQPMLASPVAFNFFSALKSIGVSPLLLAFGSPLVKYLSASSRSILISKL